jgi:hypothetical protein
MRKPAVLAADSKMPASYHNIVGAGHMTMSAVCRLFKVPDIITSNLGECARLSDILDPGDIHPCCTTIVALNFSLVRYRFDDLVGNLPAVIAVGAESGKDKLLAHGKYWMRMGSLICCRIWTGHQSINKKIGFVEILSLQQMVKHYLRGDSAYPPNRPCALRLCRITFSGVVASGGCNSSGGGGIPCRSLKKSVMKEYFDDFY